MSDGSRLRGSVTGFRPAPSAAPQALVTYHLRYLLTGSEPGTLALSQNVLSEFLFAPGNPWEATFMTTVRKGGVALLEGGLLTRDKVIQVPLSQALPATSATVKMHVFGEYFQHGLGHILEGWDHLLFVCALVLAVTRFKQLLLVVTVFTVAHTITLVLCVLGFVRLPSGIVEPMIAASIVFVALQNSFCPNRSQGAARLSVAFGFGLFHGLGFAGGLLEAMQGLDHYSIAAALTGFATGVEAGHQLVALPLFALIGLLHRTSDGLVRRQWFPASLRVASLLIAAAGSFYLVSALRAI
jgi:hydrogenase/urease accessory protein HupE